MNRRHFTKLVFGSLSLPLAMTVGCSPADQSDGWPAKPGPKVLASFAPIQCFAMNVSATTRPSASCSTSKAAPHQGQPEHVRVFAGPTCFSSTASASKTANVKTIQKGTAKKVPVVSLARR